MGTPARARDDRIEFRTSPDTRQLINRAVAASGSTLTQFAETSLTLAAQQVLADRDRFVLTGDALEEWEAINAAPARNLPGLRRLFDRPSPFTT
jgi:uncharacterized protein (DUF1778 family)